MKVWSVIFDFIMVLIIVMAMNIYYRDAKAWEEDFETIKFQRSLDLSAEAAFIEAMSQGDIGTDYNNMYDIKLNPAFTLETFETLMCLNYDMVISNENKLHIESFISTAMLLSNDGYYITKAYPVNTDNGTEWRFNWSLKIPYVMPIKNNTLNTLAALAVNLSDDRSIFVEEKDGLPYVEYLNNFDELDTKFRYTYINSDTLKRVAVKDYRKTAISSIITDALNYNIEEVISYRGGIDYKLFIPSAQTSNGINNIESPSILFVVSGADFSGNRKLNSTSISGLRTDKKIRVICYVEDGIKYYCYETQLENISLIGEFANSVEEAAKMGYIPDLKRIGKTIVR